MDAYVNRKRARLSWVVVILVAWLVPILLVGLFHEISNHGCDGYDCVYCCSHRRPESPDLTSVDGGIQPPLITLSNIVPIWTETRFSFLPYERIYSQRSRLIDIKRLL